MKAHVLSYKVLKYHKGSSGSWLQPAEPPTADIEINRIEIEPDENVSVGDEFDIGGTFTDHNSYEVEFEDFYCKVLEIESEGEGWQKLRVNAGGTVTTGPTPSQSQKGRG